MAKSAIVIALEGLGTNLLGSYGGPWASTPELDQFASRSLLLDQLWLDSTDLPSLYRSMWFGRHFAETGNQEDSAQALTTLLDQHGLTSWLVTDRTEVASLVGAEAFADALALDLASEAPVDEWQESRLAKWFESALGSWAAEEEERPSLLWIHGRGWLGEWDAPYPIRQSLVDEEDPPPPSGMSPPQHRISRDDADLIFGWSQAAAAQAIVLDRAWQWLDQTLEALQLADDCLIILIGLNGYPLGEHGVMGMELECMHAERLHVPCLIRPGLSLPLGRRSTTLAQPADLWRTLLDWFDIPQHRELERKSSHSWLASFQSPPSNSPRHAALSYSAGGSAMRVASWSALWQTNPQSSDNNEPQSKLFVHPEDRWQRNDVACRASQTLLELTAYRQQWMDWITSPSMAAEPQPSDSLRERP